MNENKSCNQGNLQIKFHWLGIVFILSMVFYGCVACGLTRFLF